MSHLEIVDAVEKVVNRDENSHWFCPRSHADDYNLFFDEDCIRDQASESEKEKSERQEKVGALNSQLDEIALALKILAFDGPDAASYWERLEAKIEQQLTRCDVCVRQFHRFRRRLKTTLESEHDDQEIQDFLQKYDQWNIHRISKGLDKATEGLLALEPQQRNINALTPEGMYALFEALNCVPFLLHEPSLRDHFDKPFQLVQTKKKIKLPSYAPGMTAFLFSANEERLHWAHRSFSSMKRDLTAIEFEFGVRPFVQRAMVRVGVASLEKEFLPTFWSAMLAILKKSSEDLLANSICALDQNLYLLALEHFQVNSEHFANEVQCFALSLEVNPKAFWSAMGEVTAQAVADTIFRSPTLHNLLKITDEKEPLKLDEHLSWCLPFIRSIKPAHLGPPTRSLLHMLLEEFQKAPCSRHAQTVSWNKGMAVLVESLDLANQLPGGLVVSDMVEMISKTHLSSIIEALDGIESRDEQRVSEQDQLALDVIEKALILDVKTLNYDRVIIQHSYTLDHDVSAAGFRICETAIKQIRPGHAALPTAILAGLTRILPLEPFTEKQLGAVETKHARQWNEALSRYLDLVESTLFEKLEAFSAEQIVELFQDSRAADGLVALLLSGEQRIHQGALTVLTTLTGEDGRRGCLMHITKIFFNITLDAITKALNTIQLSRPFTPCLTLLKVCADVYDCLCDPQDGILRSDKGMRAVDLAALKSFWSKTWAALEMMFGQTESWSTRGYKKEDMANFCRATMDFADTVFDQYGIVANRLKEASRAGNENITAKELLGYPKATFLIISGWLRLRDDYLISRSVGLTSKILIRLTDIGIEIGADAATFIEDIATSTALKVKVRSKLSMSQKAELRRALEKNLGRSLANVDDKTIKRQATLADFAKSGSTTPASMDSRSKSGVIDVDSWSAANERNKAEAAQKPVSSDTPSNEAYKQRRLALNKQQSTPLTARPNTVKQQENFLAKRKAEKEAADKAKANMLAKQTLGAGTGVKGLGDMGKDHTNKDQNVMVSSSEDEDDDDDDDVDDDLFGTANKKAMKKTIARPDVDPKGAIGLRPEQKGPTRIHRTARSAKDMRARLAPDLQALHAMILKWDFFHDGDYPPEANEHIFRAVVNSYLDSTTYQNTFEPLLSLEAWQGIVKYREELEKPKIFDIKIQNRSNVDAFIEISSLISHQENKELSLAEGDIILFSKSAKEPHRDSSAPHCLARIYRIKRTKAHLEIVYQVMSGTTLTSSLTPQAIIYGVKLQSITPLEREFGALQGLQYYDLCQQIIRASPSRKMNFGERQITAFQDNWKVNRAQSEAINAALENEGFSLIQGPPGSGKTKTIVAIVGGLLSQVLAGGSANASATRIAMPGANGNAKADDSLPKKLLVCAPSNAAVDELVIRLKDGVITTKGHKRPINVVRIGRSEAINQQVFDVTMEELVNRRLGNNDMDQKMRERNAGLFKEHESISARLRELYQKRDSNEVKGKELTELEQDIGHARKRKNELAVRIDGAKDQERSMGREQELNRKRAQQAVLDEAHVICATLSGSGHDMFRTLNVEFETVIIDEAAQCVEMSSLIPLKYGCVKCILVGDPKQLPPTVFSKEAAKFQYEQSLFVRMQNNHPNGVYLLDTQYRMHPDISIFPSRTFYDSLLKDGAGMASMRQQPWHKSALLAPYRFFDVQGQHQKAKVGGSLTNRAEIDIAIALYERLRNDFQNYDFNRKIGIITPYKSQLKMLKSTFSSRYGNEIFETIDFNTTDAFQGRESEIIIFSCVRASPAGGIGFLQDIRRMNVGLTRARSSLWVLGNSESLIRGKYWKKLVDDAKDRDLYTTGDVMSMLRKPSSAYPSQEKRDESMIDRDQHVPQMNGSKSQLAVKHEKAEPIEKLGEEAPSNGLKTESTDRMEGVTYRYQDRIANHKRKSSPSDDVKMEDVQNHEAMKSEVESNGSGRSTPMSYDLTNTMKIVDVKGGEGDTTGKATPAKHLPPTVRKRPSASPFMPAKKKVHHRPPS